MKFRNHLLPLAVLTASLTGCVHSGWSYKAVPDITMSRADDPAATGPVLLRTEGALQTPASLPPSKIDSQFRPAARQTVLVAQYRQDLGAYDTTLGKTLIVCLDGAPKPGEYWLTPDNTVLVTYSSYSAPSRERVNLVGSIKILKITGDHITADCAVRDTTEGDSSIFVDRPYDPVATQFPFMLTGVHDFTITTPSDPTFDQASLRWVTR